ncbi:MAG: aminodeoxychorismate/anthranilate synthase component II [Planctomycetales bacterium]|nr:aminodeoxychorismate/anthranilate synthase component II [Planctomycetales bacterium]MBN8627330.1 aminodeoxychorismate/anthranilate synthase component II [Planctomycetota bacterium]
MILLIDNYDSFVHNLARYVRRLGTDTRVVRNDAATVDEIRAMKPCAIILSPGPCAPRQAGCSLDVVRRLGEEVPILGICLGHQALAEGLGGRIVRSPMPVHGRTATIRHDGSRLFDGLPSPLRVARYHSLCAEPAKLPESLRVTATTDDGVVMAVEHRTLPLFGVQFHPESVLTEGGYRLLANFLTIAGLVPPAHLPTLDDERRPAIDEPEQPSVPITF